MAPAVKIGREKSDEAQLPVTQVLEKRSTGLGQLGEIAAAGAAAHEGEDDDADEQAQIAAANEQVAAALAVHLHDAQENRVRGDESPEVVGDAEHEG